MDDKQITDKTIEIDSTLIKLLPQLIADTVVISKYYKAFYESLVNEGFSGEQALQIVIARGLKP